MTKVLRKRPVPPDVRGAILERGYTALWAEVVHK
jgi:hypothetical protein